MAKLLHLELVTPEKMLLSDQVKMVVAPSSEGDIGILPHHSTIIAMLRAGVIEVHDSNAQVQKYYTDGGYVSMVNNQCIILAEEVVPLENLTKAAVKAQINELTQKIEAETCDDATKEKLQMRLVEAENALIYAN
jgi:F-type H+-transporting ATPase subunit epsilon